MNHVPKLSVDDIHRSHRTKITYSLLERPPSMSMSKNIAYRCQGISCNLVGLRIEAAFSRLVCTYLRWNMPSRAAKDQGLGLQAWFLNR